MQNKEFFEVENLYQCIDQKGEGIHPEDLSNFLNKHGIIHEKQSLENFIHFYAFKEFKDVPELLEPDKLYEKKEKSNKETLIQSESEVLNSINFNLLISKNPSELFINSILNINSDYESPYHIENNENKTVEKILADFFNISIISLQILRNFYIKIQQFSEKDYMELF